MEICFCSMYNNLFNEEKFFLCGIATHVTNRSVASPVSQPVEAKMYDAIIKTLSDMLVITGSVSFLFSAAVWLRIKALDELDEPIKVFLALNSGARKIEMPLRMRRRDMSRPELLGRLAMFVKNGERMSLAVTSDSATLDLIDDVLQRKTDELVLRCTEEELEQFNL